jgi:hypothetical protein
MFEAVVISISAIALFVGPALLTIWRSGRLVYNHRAVNPYDQNGGYKRDILSVIDSARNHITMVRGEIPFIVYDEDVANALRRAYDRGVDITLVCGPMVVVPETGSHPVLTLANEGILRLYYACRTESPHFIEADSRTLYWEAPHPPGAADREVWYLTNSSFSARRHRSRALAAIQSKRAIKVESAQERFVSVTSDQHQALQKDASAKGVNLGDLSGDELRALIACTSSGC